MKQTHDPASFWYGWRTERWATPFSGFRWGIPAYCNFEGRAIYCDSDVIFMDDVQKLFDADLKPGAAVMAKGGGSWRFCVSLWDCAEAKKHLPPIYDMRADALSHKRCGLEFRKADFVQPFPAGENWNCLDGEDKDLFDPTTKAIHYTAMANQPHLPHAIKRLAAEGRKHWFDGKVAPHWRADLQRLFDDYLSEASKYGYAPARYTTDPLFGEYKKMSLINYRAGPRA
jgi:hypothetical protein